MMSDSDEESVAHVSRSYGHGGDIFRKDDPDESIEEYEEEDETEEMDEHENEEEEDEEEEDDKTGDCDDEEGYDDDNDVDDRKIRPWDVLMNITSRNIQDRSNETVEKNSGRKSRQRHTRS